jgi:hypothetical protein
VDITYRLDDRSSTVRFPVGAGNFSHHHRVQNGSGAHPIPIQWVPGALSLGVKLTTHLHLVPRSRMSGAIPPFPQYASMTWCSVKKSTGTTFYFGDITYHHSSYHQEYFVEAETSGPVCNMCHYCSQQFDCSNAL